MAACRGDPPAYLELPLVAAGPEVVLELVGGVNVLLKRNSFVVWSETRREDQIYCTQENAIEQETVRKDSVLAASRLWSVALGSDGALYVQCECKNRIRCRASRFKAIAD